MELEICEIHQNHCKIMQNPCKSNEFPAEIDEHRMENAPSSRRQQGWHLDPLQRVRPSHRLLHLATVFRDLSKRNQGKTDRKSGFSKLFALIFNRKPI